MTAVRSAGSTTRGTAAPPPPPRRGPVRAMRARSGAGGTHVEAVAPAAATDDRVDVRAVEALALEQRLGHAVEDLQVLLEEILRAMVALADDPAELVVDLDRRRLRV